MKLRYIAGSFGVEVLGIDIFQTFISDDKQTLNHLLVDKKVVIFRDQTITPEQHKGDSILNMLFMHLLIPEFQLRHHWDPNTMIVWDNRSTTH